MPVQATNSRNPAALAEDVGNIVLLEHTNVRVPDQSLATLFYIVGMGLTRDPYMNVGLTIMSVNVGNQQLHLPTGEPQVLRGHTGLVLPDIEALKRRLSSIESQLPGTKFGWTDRGEYIEVQCPWGNLYRVFAPGRFGKLQRGMPYVEFTVARGTTERIRRFYEVVLNAPGKVEANAAFIEVGVDQTLVYRESDEQQPDFDGHHISIYVSDFSGPFHYLEERNLITDPIRNHVFRFEDIIDVDTGEPIFSVQHEVRSMRHPVFRSQFVNRE